MKIIAAVLAVGLCACSHGPSKPDQVRSQVANSGFDVPLSDDDINSDGNIMCTVFPTETASDIVRKTRPTLDGQRGTNLQSLDYRDALLKVYCPDKSND
jgi:hypothetical protein